MLEHTVQLEPGAHDCHVYRSWQDRLAVTVPFIREGLERGEHCILVSAASSFDAWRAALGAAGVDVDANERRGQLAFVTGEQWRTPLAARGSLAMARQSLKILKPLLAEFAGVRIIGDAEWDLVPRVPSDVVCHWEATANVVFEESNVRVICQYSLQHYTPDILHAALRTHAAVIWDGARHRNERYEAPRILHYEPHLNHAGSDRGLIDGILSGLRASPPSTHTNGRHAE